MHSKVRTEIYYAGFVEIPSSINATLGSTSHFMCTVQGGLLQWRINGSKLSHIQSLDQREISYTTIGRGDLRTSTLSILASVENNNSAVQCSIDNGTAEVIFSPTVVLKVQGMYVTYSALHCPIPNILIYW